MTIENEIKKLAASVGELTDALQGFREDMRNKGIVVDPEWSAGTAAPEPEDPPADIGVEVSADEETEGSATEADAGEEASASSEEDLGEAADDDLQDQPSKDEVKAALKELSRAQIEEILGNHGAATLKSLEPEKYRAVLTEAREAAVV